MNVHKNARLTLRRRQELVMRLEAGEPLKRLARGFAVSAHTARKSGALAIRPTAGPAWPPPVEPAPTSPRLDGPARLQLAAKVLRRQQWTCGQIAVALEVSAATVARVLRPPDADRVRRATSGDTGRRRSRFF